jgi:hypothetical protein
MFVSVPFSLTAPALGPVLYAYYASSSASVRRPSWGHTLLACPTPVANDRLTSTGATHDIIFFNVMKCTYLRDSTPAATLLGRRKNTLDAAKCGSIGAGLCRCRPGCLHTQRQM